MMAVNRLPKRRMSRIGFYQPTATIYRRLSLLVGSPIVPSGRFAQCSLKTTVSDLGR